MTSAAQLLSEQDHRDTWSLTIGKDMSDEDIEFVREAGAKLRELSQRYRAALREMVVRFEILDQDLNLRKDRTPIHHVESRVKTPESIIEKIGRYGKERTLENIEKYIMDIAGIRVICSYISDVYNLFDLLQRQDDLEIVTVKDYIANPKPNGYRSLHVIVRIPVYFLDSKQMVPVEIQLRTVAMDFWASLEHKLRYKKNIPDDVVKSLSAELIQCAEDSAALDNRMLDIRKQILELK